MDREFEPAPAVTATSLKEVKQSVHSDLQYISLQMEGQTYGGWYRMLSDGKMELLALANMHRERRFESTPAEQARAMLADFIRVARAKNKTKEPVSADNDASASVDMHRRDHTAGTLGALLYADKKKPRVSEQDWNQLVQSIAAGDQFALHQLFERMHRVVFTLIMRLIDNREIAEELTLEVFHDVWRQTSKYDAADGSVVGWIMNQARSKALDELKFKSRTRRIDAHANNPLPLDAANDSESFDVIQPGPLLRSALAGRIAAKTGGESALPPARQWTEPEWENVAPGISCKLLATDAEQGRVSMLVRLAPGTDYPPHTHAGVEELHLLHGELLIDDRKLYPGDYNRAEPGSADKRVWSETGCTCVLMTSTRDVIG